MLFCFADDTRQRRPSRQGLRPLVGAGAVLLPSDSVAAANRRIEELCGDVGFGHGDEFKWSPGPELWMRDNLVGHERTAFFTGVLDILADCGAQCLVVAVEEESNSATGADTPEQDVTVLLLERVSNRFYYEGDQPGVVIVDRPPGDRARENEFLAGCVDAINDDANFSAANRFALPVISGQSRFVRLLQAADVVTSSSVAFIAGEDKHSPPVFERILPTLARHRGRVGGVGVKLHPDFRLANLYHWLLGDTHFVRGNSGVPLPLSGRPFATSSGAFASGTL